jgi:hypothetical protein
MSLLADHVSKTKNYLDAVLLVFDISISKRSLAQRCFSSRDIDNSKILFKTISYHNSAIVSLRFRASLGRPSWAGLMPFVFRPVYVYSILQLSFAVMHPPLPKLPFDIPHLWQLSHICHVPSVFSSLVSLIYSPGSLPVLEQIIDDTYLSSPCFIHLSSRKSPPPYYPLLDVFRCELFFHMVSLLSPSEGQRSPYLRCFGTTTSEFLLSGRNL